MKLNNILAGALGGLVISTLFLIGGALLSNPQPQAPLGGTIAEGVANFETTLASSISDTATSMTLVSFETNDGTDLVQGRTYGFTIDEGTASEEHVIGVASTSNSIVSLTRGVSVVTGTTSVATLKKSHRRGASVKSTNAPLLLQLENIVNGTDTFPNLLTYEGTVCASASASTSICDKEYIDNLVNQGAATATESIAGISELATAQESASSTQFDVDNPHVQNSEHATDTPQNCVGVSCDIWADLGGKLKQAWLDLSEAFTWTGNHIFNGTFTTNATSTINEGGGDFDFRVEGDTDTDLLTVDAGTDRVGISTSSPSELFSVDGTLLATTIKWPDGTTQTTSGTQSSTLFNFTDIGIDNISGNGTSYASTTITGGSFTSNGGLHAKVSFTDFSGLGTSDQFFFRGSYGGSEFFGNGCIFTVNASSAPGDLGGTVDFYVFNDGSTGSQKGFMTVAFGSSDDDYGGSANNGIYLSCSGTVAVDSTASQELDLFIVTTAGYTIDSQFMVVEILD